MLASVVLAITAAANNPIDDAIADLLPVSPLYRVHPPFLTCYLGCRPKNALCMYVCGVEDSGADLGQPL